MIIDFTEHSGELIARLRISGPVPRRSTVMCSPLMVILQANLMRMFSLRVRVHELVEPVGPVGQLADPAPDLGVDVLDGRAERANEGVDPDLVDDGVDALHDLADRGDLDLEVGELELGVAHGVLEERQQVAPEVARARRS